MAIAGENKVSPYQILNTWLKDGDTKSPFPEALGDGKCISPTYLFSYFQTSLQHFPYIEKHFNNFNFFLLRPTEIFQFMKQCIMGSGYIQKFVSKDKSTDNKIYKLLKEKFPFFKREEILMVISFIDESDEKDKYYEMFGCINSGKKKLTIAEKKERTQKIKESLSVSDLIGSI